MKKLSGNSVDIISVSPHLFIFVSKVVYLNLYLLTTDFASMEYSL